MTEERPAPIPPLGEIAKSVERIVISLFATEEDTEESYKAKAKKLAYWARIRFPDIQISVFDETGTHGWTYRLSP